LNTTTTTVKIYAPDRPSSLLLQNTNIRNKSPSINDNYNNKLMDPRNWNTFKQCNLIHSILQFCRRDSGSNAAQPSSGEQVDSNRKLSHDYLLSLRVPIISYSVGLQSWIKWETFSHTAN